MKKGKREYWTCGVLLCFAVFLVFSPSLFSELLAWDDDINIIGNSLLHSTNVSDIGSFSWMFGTEYLAQWRPLNWLFYWCQYELFGLSPLGYHLVSIFLHTIATWLLYSLILSLASSLESRYRKSYVLAAVVAFIWAVHPLRVEVVSWVSAQAHTLNLCFLLMSTHCFVRSVGGKLVVNRWFLLSHLFFALALLVYPSGITIPGVFVLLELFVLIRGRRYRFRDVFSIGGLRFSFKYSGYFAISLGVAAMFLVPNDGESEYYNTVVSFENRGVLRSVLEPMYILGFSFWKHLLPSGLNAYYYVIGEIPMLSRQFFVPVVWGGFVLGTVIIGNRRNCLMWPVLGCYLLLLLPFFGFFGLVLNSADRYSYLGSCVIGIWMFFLLGNVSNKSNIGAKWLRMGSALILILIIGVNIRVQKNWRETLSLLETIISNNEVHPDLNFIKERHANELIKLLNRSNELFRMERYEEALILYDKAEFYGSESYELYFGRALSLVMLGQIDLARDQVILSLEKEPNSKDALGLLERLK